MRTLCRFRCALTSLAFLAALIGSARASILIVSPHPDDDALTAAGITYDANSRGEPVRIVYVTNGDAEGTAVGLLREQEAVASQMGRLGTQEQNLIFLGYPDVWMSTLYASYPNATDTFVSPNTGKSTTYGNRGLGGTDYHTYR